MIAWAWLDASGEEIRWTRDVLGDEAKPRCGNCRRPIPREVAALTDTPLIDIPWERIDFAEMWPCPHCGAKNLVILGGPAPIASAHARKRRQDAVDAVLGRVLGCKTPVLCPSVLALAGEVAS